MKKLILLLMFLPLLGLVSCVKQQNCYCGLSTISGTFVYFEEPKEIIYCGYEQKVNALLISDSLELEYYIIGSIPKTFQTKDTIYVMTCLEEVKRKGACLAYGVGSIYKLKCIEEI